MVSRMDYIRVLSSQGRSSSENAVGMSGMMIPKLYYALAALSFVAIIAATSVALEKTPAKFRASANLLVLLSDDYGSRPIASSSNISQQSTMDRDAYISAEMDILMSDAVIDEAIAKVGPTVLYPDITRPPGVIRLMMNKVGSFIAGFKDDGADEGDAALRLAHRAVLKSFRVDSERSGNVISITYDGADRFVATKFLVTLIDAYFARRSIFFADEQATILEALVETKAKELEDARAALDDFQQKYAIFDFALQREALLKRLGGARSDLQVAMVNAAEVEARRRTVSAQLAELPAASVEVSHGQEIVVRRGNFAADLEKEAYQLDQELSASTVRRQNLVAELKAAEGELQEFAGREPELEELKLRQSLLERKYVQSVETLDARRSVEVVAEARHSNVKLVNHPSIPNQPTTQRLLIAVAGLMLALFSACAILILGWQIRARRAPGAPKETSPDFSPAGPLERRHG
jgi:hypothetical protein